MRKEHERNNLPVIGIHGAPRSGTSWLGQLFNSHPHVAYRYQPFFSYAFRDRIHHASSPIQLEKLFEDLLHTEDDFVLQRRKERLARYLPHFHKAESTHLVYKEVRFHQLTETILSRLPEAKVVGIMRDPRAVLASWYLAPREFNPEWDFATEWRTAESKNEGKAENWYGFERWKQLAGMFLELEQRFDQQFMIVDYSSLVSDTGRLLKLLFDFCGLRWCRQTEDFIADSKSMDDDDPYGVMRGSRTRSRSWRQTLHPDIAEAIWKDLRQTPYTRFLTEHE